MLDRILRCPDHFYSTYGMYLWNSETSPASSKPPFGLALKLEAQAAAQHLSRRDEAHQPVRSVHRNVALGEHIAEVGKNLQPATTHGHGQRLADTEIQEGIDVVNHFAKGILPRDGATVEPLVAGCETRPEVRRTPRNFRCETVAVACLHRIAESDAGGELVHRERSGVGVDESRFQIVSDLLPIGGASAPRGGSASIESLREGEKISRQIVRIADGAGKDRGVPRAVLVDRHGERGAISGAMLDAGLIMPRALQHGAPTAEHHRGEKIELRERGFQVTCFQLGSQG